MKRLGIITILLIFSIGGFIYHNFKDKPHPGTSLRKDPVKTSTVKSLLSQEDPFDSSTCISSTGGVRIHTYIFHYVIPDKYVDPKNKVEYGNSVSPKFFDDVMKRLYDKRTKKLLYIASLKDLETFSLTDCYPSKDIVLLMADDGWDDNYNYLFPIVKKYRIPFSLAIISSKVSQLPSEINNFANESEIKDMIDSKLIYIASHTISHFDLRKLPEDQVKVELCDSKRSLEDMFGIRINSIVYPSGKYDDRVVRIAKQCGYGFGFATSGAPFTAEDLKMKPFLINRERITRSSKLEDLFNFGVETNLAENKGSSERKNGG